VYFRDVFDKKFPRVPLDQQKQEE